MNDLIEKQHNFLQIVNYIVTSNKLSHSYLIEINDFDSDIEYIKSFIKMILCNEKEISFDNLDCKKCNICKLVDDNNYPDLKIIESEGQWIKKNQLLELKEEYQNKSLLDNKRIYIIRDAEKLNPSSANTILKFLEEPEEGIIAILLTKNRYKVIDTILSRCQILSLKKDSVNTMLDDNTLKLIEYLVSGDELFINYKKIVDDILVDKVVAKDIFLKIENIFVDYLNYVSNSDYPADEYIISILDNCKNNDIVKYIMIIEEELPKLMYNVNYKIWLDLIFAKFIEVRKCMM